MDANDPAARATALSKIEAPAIGLVVGAGLGLVVSVGSMGVHALGVLGVPLVRGADERAFVFLSTVWGVGISLVWIVLCAFVVWAGLGLRSLRSYPLGLAAAVISVLPCMAPCCPISIPFGIWALIVMHAPDVRAQFRA